MTDLEMIKLCAEAMETSPTLPGISNIWGCTISYKNGQKKVYTWLRNTYNPLTDDTQAMEIVKHLRLRIEYDECDDLWIVDQSSPKLSRQACQSEDPNLNRAIVSCVAKM